MATRSQLEAQHAAAGAAYLAALAALRKAVIDLGALDRVLSNAHCGGTGSTRSFASGALYAFRALDLSSHAAFPSPAPTGDLVTAIQTAGDAHIRSFTPG
jgi:hypothetical protein